MPAITPSTSPKIETAPSFHAKHDIPGRGDQQLFEPEKEERLCQPDLSSERYAPLHILNGKNER
jgi:hypothetical protein